MPRAPSPTTAADTETPVSSKKPPLRHIAIIMDGNRRWAREHRLPIAAGHSEGVKALKQIVFAMGNRKLEALTVYAFSTENWHREDAEVNALLSLFLVALSREIQELHRNGVRLRFIGDLTPFPAKLRKALEEAVALTADNTGLKFQVALNYGSRDELTRAVQHLAHAVQAGRLAPDEISETHISNALYTADLPDPDLLIRTGGEYRLSNYLLWQCAYAELFITETLWPDFTPAFLDHAIAIFSERERRFGQ